MCEEIAGLARKYMEDSHCDGLREIDGLILEATDESRWEDVSKWHRVRIRFLRFQQERVTMAQYLSPASRASDPRQESAQASLAC